MSSDATRFAFLGSSFAETGSTSETTWTLCSPLVSSILFYSLLIIYYPQPQLDRIGLNTSVSLRELLIIIQYTRVHLVLLSPQNNILIHWIL